MYFCSQAFYLKRASGIQTMAEKIPAPVATLTQPQPLLCIPTSTVYSNQGQLVDLQSGPQGNQAAEETQLCRPNLAATTEYDGDFAAESLYAEEDMLQWLAAGGGDEEEEGGGYFGAAGVVTSDLTDSTFYGIDPLLQLLPSQYSEYPAYPSSPSAAVQTQSQHQVMGELAGVSPRPLSAFSESIAAGWKVHLINASSSSAVNMDSSSFPMATASAYCVPFTVLDQNDGDCCSGDEMLGMNMGIGVESFDGSGYGQDGPAAALSLPIAVADATITVRPTASLSFAPLDKRDSDPDNNWGGDDSGYAPVALKRIRSIDSQGSQSDGNQLSQPRSSGDQAGRRSLKPPLKERCMEYRPVHT